MTETTESPTPPTKRQLLEAHALACRAALEREDVRPALPAELRDLRDADLSGADLRDADLSGADLSGADLRGAYLRDAYLRDADLRDADLSGADLRGADLSGADLSGAYLRDAYLRDAYLRDADLRDADLSDADLSGADLRGAYLRDAVGAPPNHVEPTTPFVRNPALGSDAERAARYRELHPNVPVVPQLDLQILRLLESGQGELEMGDWHTCETTHCRGGWAIMLAGDPGRALEREVGVVQAARAIYRASTGRAPHFYADNERAMADIKRCAAEQSEPTEATPAP